MNFHIIIIFAWRDDHCVLRFFLYMLDYYILTMTALFSFECVVWVTSIFWRRYQGVCNDPLIHFNIYAFLFIVQSIPIVTPIHLWLVGTNSSITQLFVCFYAGFYVLELLNLEWLFFIICSGRWPQNPILTIPSAIQGSF